MPVAGLQAVQRQDALADQLVVVVVDRDAQYGKIWQDYLEGRDGGNRRVGTGTASGCKGKMWNRKMSEDSSALGKGGKCA